MRRLTRMQIYLISILMIALGVAGLVNDPIPTFTLVFGLGLLLLSAIP